MIIPENEITPEIVQQFTDKLVRQTQQLRDEGRTIIPVFAFLYAINNPPEGPSSLDAIASHVEIWHQCDVPAFCIGGRFYHRDGGGDEWQE